MLRALYLTYFEHDPVDFNWQMWAEKAGVDRQVAMVNYTEVVQNGLAEGRVGGWARISARGIIEAEGKGLAPPDRRARNEEVRQAMLRSLATAYREAGSRGFLRWEQLAREAQVSEREFLENQPVLRALDLIDSIEIGSYRITRAGLSQVEEEDRRLLERSSGEGS